MERMEGQGREQKERDRGVKLMFKLIPTCGVTEPNILFHILPWLPGSSKPHFVSRGDGLAWPGFDLVETRVVSGSQAAPSSHLEHKTQRQPRCLPGRQDIRFTWQEVGLSGGHNPEPSERPAAWKAPAKGVEAHGLQVWPRACDVSFGEAPVSALLASCFLLLLC